MLRDYLNQVAIHKTSIGNNIYLEPEFEEKEISCRIVEKFKEVTDEKGNKVISSCVIQCVDTIKIGDYIDDKKVIAVNSMTSFNRIIGYKGYLL
ncbi:MAG TPA: hypothetical protein K8U79_03605 [Clostridium perfringens]|nr:hypothetical protein [Clostridium perfringens]